MRYSYEIIDILGNKIDHGSIDSPTDNYLYNINLPDALPGTYIIVLREENMILSKQKFIISK